MTEERVNPHKLPNSEAKIKQYLKTLPTDILGIEDIGTIEILAMTPGSYNHNFHVKVNRKEFIFRINIEQQSGLTNQIEYEYRILKFLENHAIAPKAFHFDAGKDFFEFDILIEEYLAGPHMSLEQGDTTNVAELLARLHSLKPENMQHIVWKNPLADTYKLPFGDLEAYKAKITPDEKTIRLAENLLEKAQKVVTEYQRLFQADCLNHTDLALDNFIQTPKGLRLIDWEKPRLDDFSYDLCCFLSEPCEMWCSRKVLDRKERNDFLDAYARFSGKDIKTLGDKVKIREPLVSLHWILWGAIKLCDLRDQSTSPELIKAHEEKRARYERISDPANIEKLLDTWEV